MFISEIQLNNYRNYEIAKVELSEGINVLLGENAQGKTNLLEAVYLCSIGKSMRTPRDRELIRYECNRAKISAVTKSAVGTNRVDIVLEKHDNKRVSINGAQASKLGELMGIIRTVLFSPDEMAIIKDGPSERRRFMDIALCQLSRAYFYLLQRYNKILSQRNRLLKNKVGSETLDVWDLQLAYEGAKIIKTRKGFVSRMNELTQNVHNFLTDNKENLTLNYESIAGKNENEIRENFLAELNRTRVRDCQNGFTHIGAHTDDFSVMANEIDLRKYGSQGQQRTAALTLKLALLDLFKTETNESSILLLDDVFSELDKNRQKRLIEKLKGHQTIITCTHLDDTIFSSREGMRIFYVKDGVVTLEQK